MNIASMRGGGKDSTTRVSSLSNKEPLVGVKVGIDIVREIVGEDHGYGSDSVIREGEASLRCGGDRSAIKGSSCTQNGDVSCDGGVGCHR